MDNQLQAEVNAMARAMSAKAHPMRLSMAEYVEIAEDELAKEYEKKMRELLCPLKDIGYVIEGESLTVAEATAGCRLSYWATAYATARALVEDIGEI